MLAPTATLKHTRQCPECGGTEIYTKRIDGNGGRGPMLLANLQRSLLDRPKFDAFICAGCGYYQLFVGEEWLEKGLRSKWQRHG